MEPSFSTLMIYGGLQNQINEANFEISNLQRENLQLRQELHNTTQDNLSLNGGFVGLREESFIIGSMRRTINELAESNNNLVQANKNLTQTNASLLKENRALKKAYNELSELMAEWIVSQKAFKELAIQFGYEKGLSKDEVFLMSLEKEIGVIEGKHNPEHNTNANKSNTVRPYIEKLKQKNQKDKISLMEKIKKNSQ